MGRRRTIDRDHLLDAAEAVIAREGAAGLTIDAVAKEMGITKGGVQYCFGTKDALIDAIFERWGKAYDSLFEAVAGKQPTPLTRVRAHAEATQRSDELSSSKAAALMAALIQTPEHLEGSNQWYRSRLEGLDLSAPEGRRARLAFLAVEGAFMLRYFRLMDWPGRVGLDARRRPCVVADGGWRQRRLRLRWRAAGGRLSRRRSARSSGP